ncbi:MAG: 4Fe-4S dicluster domain-containing protein [Gemmatimonadetes bacterium]|nr:4Fe-4S dicluster domain-containing protein [Gemmatimonadota bacterium]
MTSSTTHPQAADAHASADAGHLLAPAHRCALPGTPLAEASAGLDACVHCGFCLQACPTYVNLEDEADSPRGRLVLMRRLLDGDIPLDDPSVGTHIDRCLGCRGCETACPSGVPYGELLEATRATMATVRGRPFVARLVLGLFRRHQLLHAMLAGARLLRATGVPSLLARILPERLAFPFAMLASTAPVPELRVRGASRVPPAPGGTPAAPGAPRTATLLTGCVMDGLFGHVHDATTHALTHNGVTVRATPAQRCCGALHAHAGDLEGARALARENIAAFERTDADVIVVNSAGCGAMIKQYPHLLHSDSGWAPRAERLAARVRDVSEALVALGPVRGTRPVALRVTHDPPCHQLHAQRIAREPLAMLDAVPALTRLPLEDADQCCGAAGIYNLIEPDTSDAVLAPKLARIRATGAAFVATGNPGCLMQLGGGLMRAGASVRAVHPVELLAASYDSTAAPRS